MTRSYTFIATMIYIFERMHSLPLPRIQITRCAQNNGMKCIAPEK